MLTVRIDNPRRSFPTLRVFLNLELVIEQDIYRDDASRIRSHFADHADEITSAAYPQAAVRRILAEATR